MSVLRLKAYVLAADPAWIEASVLSYYDLVEEIVVSYDKDGRGWTGVPIPVEECLRRLKAIDRDGKMRYVPGHYARLDHHPMENETYQRQCAIDAIGETCDWVLQLDTDEVLATPDVFLDCLRQAEDAGDSGLNYPARHLFVHARGRAYLEVCDRGWRLYGHYPGPVVVRAACKLEHARRIPAPLFHVDYSWNPKNGFAPAHNLRTKAVVRPADAIFHFSWVRSHSYMEQKTRSWGHALDRDWSREISRWKWCGRHPVLATCATQFLRGPRKIHLRPCWLPPSVSRLIAETQLDPATGEKQ
ncbi:MAG: hypothetical protein ACUVSM_03505 [Armatimonadota bacterium]